MSWRVETYAIADVKEAAEQAAPAQERDDAAPVRAYFKLTDDNYEQTKNIIKVEEKRRSLLEQALSELRTFQRKYSMLKELAEVFAEIDKANRKNEESA